MERLTQIVASKLHTLPAEFLVALPGPHVFVAHHPDLDGPVTFTTHELAEPRDGWTNLTFDGVELRALIIGVRCERFDEQAFLDLCVEKTANPQLRITLANTVGDALPNAMEGLSALAFFQNLCLVLIYHGSPESSLVNPIELCQAA